MAIVNLHQLHKLTLLTMGPHRKIRSVSVCPVVLPHHYTPSTQKKDCARALRNEKYCHGGQNCPQWTLRIPQKLMLPVDCCGISKIYRRLNPQPCSGRSDPGRKSQLRRTVNRSQLFAIIKLPTPKSSTSRRSFVFSAALPDIACTAANTTPLPNWSRHEVPLS